MPKRFGTTFSPELSRLGQLAQRGGCGDSALIDLVTVTVAVAVAIVLFKYTGDRADPGCLPLSSPRFIPAVQLVEAENTVGDLAAGSANPLIWMKTPSSARCSGFNQPLFLESRLVRPWP
jgi:hypothetical protein